MLLYEPPPTPGDLHFRLFGFPVRVHPWFWLSTVILGLAGSGEETDPMELVAWVGVVFVSILVHELGHAIAQRRYGGHPWITLHAMGGLASCDDCDRRTLSQIIISLAGPFAGFVLVALTLLAVQLAGHRVGISLGDSIVWDSGVEPPALGMSMVGMRFFWSQLPNPLANQLLGMLLHVNILWGLVNLLPIYPLDGGRVSRELFTLGDPRRGIIGSLWLSAIAAAAVAVYGLTQLQSFYMAFFFGYLAYASYSAVQSYRSSRL